MTDHTGDGQRPAIVIIQALTSTTASGNTRCRTYCNTRCRTYCNTRCCTCGNTHCRTYDNTRCRSCDNTHCVFKTSKFGLPFIHGVFKKL